MHTRGQMQSTLTVCLAPVATYLEACGSRTHRTLGLNPTLMHHRIDYCCTEVARDEVHTSTHGQLL